MVLNPLIIWMRWVGRAGYRDLRRLLDHWESLTMLSYRGTDLFSTIRRARKPLSGVTRALDLTASALTAELAECQDKYARPAYPMVIWIDVSDQAGRACPRVLRSSTERGAVAPDCAGDTACQANGRKIRSVHRYKYCKDDLSAGADRGGASYERCSDAHNRDYRV